MGRRGERVGCEIDCLGGENVVSLVGRVGVYLRFVKNFSYDIFVFLVFVF